MEKERKIKTISLIALIVAVVGLTVAFASLSTTLTINGSGSIDSASWDVHFENLSSAKTKGSGRQVSAPNISLDGLSVENINVALSKPKDEVEYTVDIKNDGTINAEITSIEKSTLTQEQEKYFEFTATYKDGTSVEESNVINAKDKEQVIIRVRFKSNVTSNDLPKTTQTINLSLKLNYVQSDNIKVTTTPKKETYEVGDEFCLGSECFYVIKDNETTVTALAKYNLHVGLYYKNIDDFFEGIFSEIPVDEEGYGLQDSSIIGEDNYYEVWQELDCDYNVENPQCLNYITKYMDSLKGTMFFVDPNTYGNTYWKNYNFSKPVFVYNEQSNLFNYVLNYQQYLITQGYSSVSASILNYDQVVELGCASKDSPGTSTCDNTFSWLIDRDFFTGYTTGPNIIFVIRRAEEGQVSLANPDIDASTYGLRPVITINKNEL